jgi:hypothetical protein
MKIQTLRNQKLNYAIHVTLQRLALLAGPLFSHKEGGSNEKLRVIPLNDLDEQQ